MSGTHIFSREFLPRLVAALLLSTSLAQAQQPQQQQPAIPPGQRPVPMQPAQALSPELEKVLLRWEQEAAKTPKVKGELKRWKYDDTFQVVKESQGTFWYEVPDKGRLEMTPVKDIPPGSQTKADGKEYARQAADPETWVSNGKVIYYIDPLKKQYNQIDIPEEMQGQNIGKGPLPFLFGMKAADLKARYRLEFGSSHGAQQIHLIAFPLQFGEQVEYIRAEILLSPQTSLPIAIQLIHPNDTQRTVYRFLKHDPVSLWLPSSPFNINETVLKLQYKKILEEQMPKEATGPNGIMQR